MKAIIFAASLAIGVAGFATAGLATGGVSSMDTKFGEVTEVMVHGHMMHMQMIKNAAGDEFVVIPAAEAMMMLSPKTRVMVMGKLFTPY
jgi:hypothetical protein